MDTDSDKQSVEQALREAQAQGRLRDADEQSTTELPEIEHERQSTWRFVRTAGPDDPSYPEVNGSLWDAGVKDGKPELWWLTPRDVQVGGLVDKLRAGIEEERARGVRMMHPSEAPSDEDTEPAESWWQGAELQGGHTADWRWDFVEGLVIIDNKPALERDRIEAFAEGRPPGVQFQSLCMPAEVIQAMATMLSRGAARGGLGSAG